MSVSRLIVVGLGLIGGSIAAAACKRLPGVTVRAVDPDEAALAFAREAALIDEGATPDAALAQGWFAPGAADLVVLATPVAVTAEWLGTLAAEGYDGIVTDACSTKRAVVSAARSAGGRYRFVGGHPMAGSERSGVSAADAALLDGAYYILTPDPTTDMDSYRRVHAFVTALGARVLSLDASAHDEAVALVSHVPHIAAAALVSLAQAGARNAGTDVLRLAAGGFKDTTRIAAGSPELWTGIVLDNAEAIDAGIAELESVLADFRARVVSGDAAAIGAWLTEAADVRRALPAQWVPATTQLTELLVPVADRPGVVGAVTTAASRAGCNIEDIEIDHQSEDRAVLRLVLTDEGDVGALVEDLRAQGFAPDVRPLEGES
jgi:prephenate dehydrogenase